MANENLPGISFEFKDNGLMVVVPEGPVTDSMLIIGNAVDGPTGVPIRVDSQSVESLFGPLVYNASYAPANILDSGTYNGNNLVKAFYEASLGGCRDIILFRVGGTRASTYTATGSGATTTSVPASTELGLGFTALYPGQVYNDMLIQLAVTKLASSGTGSADIGKATLTLLQAGDASGSGCDIRKGSAVTYTLVTSGTTPSAKRIRDVLTAINGDKNNTTVRAELPAGSTYTMDTLISQAVGATNVTGAILTYTKSYRLSGGTDGTRQVGEDFDDSVTTGKSWSGFIDEVAVSDIATNSGLRNLYRNLMEDDIGAFDVLYGNVEPDIVYLACLYADENVGNATNTGSGTVAVEFAKALHTGTVDNYPMVGVMGISPLSNSTRPYVKQRVLELIDDDETTNSGKLVMADYISKALDSDVTAFSGLDADNNDVDFGRYLMLVAGPDVFIGQNQLGMYIDSPAGLFAGMLTTLPPDITATNKVLPGQNGLAFEFTSRELNKLCGGQPWDDVSSISGLGGSYITLKRNTTGNAVVTVDNTCASRNSDFANYQIMDIVNTVAGGIKRIVSPYIGQAGHASTRASMRTQVKSYLDSVAETRAIVGGEGVGYNFTISANATDAYLGRIRIELTLRPALQIKEINVIISVSPPIGG